MRRNKGKLTHSWRGLWSEGCTFMHCEDEVSREEEIDDAEGK